MRIIHGIVWVILGFISHTPLTTGGLIPHISRYTYVIKLRTPSGIRRLDGWRLLYKGECLSFHGNLTKIIEKHCIFSFSLVVTPDIYCTNRTLLSSLRHMELKPGEPVRWFDLNLVFGKDAWEWEINELDANDIPKILPHHAVVFLYDPALIKSLEKPYKTAYSLDTIHEGGCCNFELPTMVIAGSEVKLHEALIHSQDVFQMEIATHHTPSLCITQVIDGIHCAVDVT